MLGILIAIVMYAAPMALDIIGFSTGDYAMAEVGLIWLIISIVLTGILVLIGYINERKNSKGV